MERTDVAEWDLSSTKVILCRKEYKDKPVDCPFASFSTDGCSIIKTTSKDIFRRVKSSVADRGEGVRSFYCKCLSKEHPVSGRMQEHIERREMPKVNYPGGPNEDHFLRQQPESYGASRRAS